MTSTQARIADTIEIFYGAADRNSDGGMAGHAYKRSVDDLDSSFTRELVRNTRSSALKSWLLKTPDRTSLTGQPYQNL
jgi:bridging integrator 3